MKTCKTCEETKPLEDFYPHKTTRDRLSQACRSCTQAANRAYRARNTDALKAAALAKRERNRDQLAARSRAYYAENRETVRAAQVAYYEANKAAFKERNSRFHENRPSYSREYEKSRKDVKTEYNKQYRALDPFKWRAYVNEYAMARHAHKGRATPPWADRRAIRTFYIACQLLAEVTGEPHEVDHVIPLKGKTVCGLHVETNLQILPTSDNRAKSNYFDGWNPAP